MNEKNLYSPPSAELVTLVENNLAGRWARLGGSLIDGVVAGVVIFPVMYVTGFWSKVISDNMTMLDTVLLGLFGLAVYLILNGYLLSRYGQTIGKKVVGTKIVSVDSDEILPLWKIFFIRYLPVNVVSQTPLVGPLLVIIDSLFIFRGDKRCIHDLVAGTKVIKADAH